MIKKLTVLAAVLVTALPAVAETEPSGKSLAATIDVFVFPSDGQDSSQQSQDEGECYNWATANTGSDPFELMKKQESDEQQAAAEMAAAQQTGRGAGARGAVRGAAAGAIVGEIVDDDAGKGASYGAAAGAISSRRRGRAAKQQAVAQAEQQQESREQATGKQVEDFKKAFSVCLEAKDYMVKF